MATKLNIFLLTKNAFIKNSPDLLPQVSVMPKLINSYKLLI